MSQRSDIFQYLSFSVWLISLNIMPSKSIYIAANAKFHSFLMIKWLYTHTHIPHPQPHGVHGVFIHSSLEGYGFHILAIISNIAINNGVNIYLFKLVFLFLLGTYLGLKLLGHMVVLFLVFWEISILLSIGTVPVYNPTNNVRRFPFLHILASICRLCSFFVIAILTGVRW